jgi:hypothetical protein
MSQQAVEPASVGHLVMHGGLPYAPSGVVSNLSHLEKKFEKRQ